MSLNSSVQPAVPPGSQINDLCLQREMYLPFLVMFNVKLPDFLEWPRQPQQSSACLEAHFRRECANRSSQTEWQPALRRDLGGHTERQERIYAAPVKSDR